MANTVGVKGLTGVNVIHVIVVSWCNYDQLQWEGGKHKAKHKANFSEQIMPDYNDTDDSYTAWHRPVTSV